MNWELNSVFYYFDNRERNCIAEYSNEYGKLSDAERKEADRLMKNRIEGHLDQMSGDFEQIQMAAECIVDDIYRSVNLAYMFNGAVFAYLNATAKVAMDWFTRRGLQIHYLTNNTYSDMTRPFRIFEPFFNAAGLEYICPQHILWEVLNEKREITMEIYRRAFDTIGHVARNLWAKERIEDCCKSGRHYLHLDIDGDDDSFKVDTQFAQKDGHLVVFRSENPLDNPHVHVLLCDRPSVRGRTC